MKDVMLPEMTVSVSSSVLCRSVKTREESCIDVRSSAKSRRPRSYISQAWMPNEIEAILLRYRSGRRRRKRFSDCSNSGRRVPSQSTRRQLLTMRCCFCGHHSAYSVIVEVMTVVGVVMARKEEQYAEAYVFCWFFKHRAP